MERGNTKQDILHAALHLFSVQGFEATSVSQIAERVGIRKASLYSHFESKQAVLDALISEVLNRLESHSFFDASIDGSPLTPDTLVQRIQAHIRFILHDPTISRARKMLVIEQFRNTELAKLQTKQNYSAIMQYYTARMQGLCEQGVLANHDHEIMAAQFCLPISMWINLCDREPERETEIMDCIEKHIRQFFVIYQPKAQSLHPQKAVDGIHDSVRIGTPEDAPTAPHK